MARIGMPKPGATGKKSDPLLSLQNFDWIIFGIRSKPVFSRADQAIMDLNPYQPPVAIPTEEVGRWKRLIQRIRRVWGGSRSNLGIADGPSGPSLQFVLSGRAFIEYGVVFSAMSGATDRFFAALPLTIDDEVHRQRNVAEAARVLRELVTRVDGLDNALNGCDLVVSMVPSYRELGTELHRVIIPAEAWRQSDEADELYLQWPELD